MLKRLFYCCAALILAACGSYGEDDDSPLTCDELRDGSVDEWTILYNGGSDCVESDSSPIPAATPSDPLAQSGKGETTSYYPQGLSTAFCLNPGFSVSIAVRIPAGSNELGETETSFRANFYFADSDENPGFFDQGYFYESEAVSGVFVAAINLYDHDDEGMWLLEYVGQLSFDDKTYPSANYMVTAFATVAVYEDGGTFYMYEDDSYDYRWLPETFIVDSSEACALLAQNAWDSE